MLQHSLAMAWLAQQSSEMSTLLRETGPPYPCAGVSIMTLSIIKAIQVQACIPITLWTLRPLIPCKRLRWCKAHINKCTVLIHCCMHLQGLWCLHLLLGLAPIKSTSLSQALTPARARMHQMQMDVHLHPMEPAHRFNLDTSDLWVLNAGWITACLEKYCLQGCWLLCRSLVARHTINSASSDPLCHHHW